MKNVAFILFLLLGSFAIQAQTTANVDSQGNYVQVVIPKTEADLQKNATNTGKTFTDKSGSAFPVWQTKSGALFCIKISKKSGNPYRAYFKVKK